jgi:hypothetical protein
MLVELATDLLFEIDVSYSLLHHSVDRIESGLDIIWLCSEEVTNYWYAIALLSLLNVLEVVHQLSLFELEIGVNKVRDLVLFVVVIVMTQVIFKGWGLSKCEIAGTYVLHN